MPYEVDLSAGALLRVKNTSASNEGNKYYAKLPLLQINHKKH